MKRTRATIGIVGAAGVFLAAGYLATDAQTPVPAPQGTQVAQAGGGRGRGGIPGASPQQLVELAGITARLQPFQQAVAAARQALATATFAIPPDTSAVAAAVEKVRATEIALANGRATAFADFQKGPLKLTDEQVQALVAAGGVVNAPPTGGRGRTGPAVGPPPAGRGGN